MFLSSLAFLGLAAGVASASRTHWKLQSGVTIEKVPFKYPSQGETVANDLYLPSDLTKPVPVTVTAPGFAGVKEIIISDYATKLAEAGIATLAMDPLGFGESTGKYRQEINITEQLTAMKDAFDLLEKDKRFDSQRMAVWGTSLSGGHALNFAGTDVRIKSAVGIIPHIVLDETALGERAIFFDDIAKDMEAKASGAPRIMIAVSGPPGSKSIMNEPGAMEFLSMMAKMAPNYKNEVTAVSLLSMGEYNNTAVAQKITIPTLVISATNDTITPGKTIHNTLDSVKSVTIKDFPGNHFGLLGNNRDETVTLTVDWFKKYL